METPVKNGEVIFDLETGSAGELFRYRPHDEAGFIRLAGSVRPGDEPCITSTAGLLDSLKAAPVITGHNVLGFDLLALAYHYGADWDALAAKARDTELIARQAWPPRSRDTHSADSFDLTSVAERLGLEGKTDSMLRLKRKHGGYDRIPVDDAEYRSYLEGDLRATAAVAERIGPYLDSDPYLRREHRLAAIAGRMTLNGIRVDEKLLTQRLEAGENRKRDALELLRAGWGLPLGKIISRGRGKNKTEEFREHDSPLSTLEGREWLAGIWERYQVPDPPRTEKGKLAIGNDDLKSVAELPGCPADLRSLLSLMGIVTGTRTVYGTARDCLGPDGRVHPLNTFRQASGRWSVTNPGMTVFGKRNGRHVERDIFIPDEGHVILCFDLSQVDMRAMAGHSQDPAYSTLFDSLGEKDAHREIARQIGVPRQDAKAIGHGWNYGLGARKMIGDGLDPAKVEAFIAGMEARFPVLIAWREEIRARGKAGEILDNGFGRRMMCEPSRAYTVAPALMGQGATRDIAAECLLRMPPEIHPMLRVFVHDEFVFSVPRQDVMDVAAEVKKAMTWRWCPPGGTISVPIICDMSAGLNWGQASEK